jgi:hypothetical protein
MIVAVQISEIIKRIAETDPCALIVEHHIQMLSDLLIRFCQRNDSYNFLTIFIRKRTLQGIRDHFFDLLSGNMSAAGNDGKAKATIAWSKIAA